MEWAGNQHGPSLCAGSGALARTPPSVCLSPSASQLHGSLRSTLLFSIQFTLGQIRENKLRTEQTRTCIQSKDGHPFWGQSPQGKLLQFIIFHFLISSSSPALKSQEEPVARTFQRLSLSVGGKVDPAAGPSLPRCHAQNAMLGVKGEKADR